VVDKGVAIMIPPQEQTQGIGLEPLMNAIDYIAAGVTIGVLAGVITWVAALATAVWAVFRAMNEIHKWKNRKNLVGTDDSGA
jgi:cell division protein FtsX